MTEFLASRTHMGTAPLDNILGSSFPGSSLPPHCHPRWGRHSLGAKLGKALPVGLLPANTYGDVVLQQQLVLVGHYGDLVREISWIGPQAFPCAQEESKAQRRETWPWGHPARLRQGWV